MRLNNKFELSMVLDTEKFHKVLTRTCNNAEYFDENDDKYVDQSLASKGITVTYRNSQYKKKSETYRKFKSVIEESKGIFHAEVRLTEPKAIIAYTDKTDTYN